MNCYKVILFCFISLFSLQDKQFVDFKADEAKISKDQEYITITLPFEILENYHIQSEKIFDNNLIPTEVHFDVPDGYKILNYQFSKVNRGTITLDQLKCEVLSNDLEVTLLLEQRTTSNKAPELKGYLYYQACDDRQCFYPRNLHFNVKWAK
jgi:hypothetical protein